MGTLGLGRTGWLTDSAPRARGWAAGRGAQRWHPNPAAAEVLEGRVVVRGAQVVVTAAGRAAPPPAVVVVPYPHRGGH